MLYTLNLHNAVCWLNFNKTKEKEWILLIRNEKGKVLKGSSHDYSPHFQICHNSEYRTSNTVPGFILNKKIHEVGKDWKAYNFEDTWLMSSDSCPGAIIHSKIWDSFFLWGERSVTVNINILSDKLTFRRRLQKFSSLKPRYKDPGIDSLETIHIPNPLHILKCAYSYRMSKNSGCCHLQGTGIVQYGGGWTKNSSALYCFEFCEDSLWGWGDPAALKKAQN